MGGTLEMDESGDHQSSGGAENYRNQRAKRLYGERPQDWLLHPPPMLSGELEPLKKGWLQFAMTQANDGIHRYDEFLFKIRTWWMGLASLFLIAVLGFERVSGGGAKKVWQLTEDFGLIFFILSAVGVSFWLMDALNKSLQMVQIHMARDLEQAQFFKINQYSVTKARRYAMRSGRHLRAMFTQISEESVALYYLLPILGFGVVIGGFDLASGPGLQQIQQGNFLDVFNPLNRWTLSALLMIALLLAISQTVHKLSFLTNLLEGYSERARKRHLASLLGFANGYKGMMRIRGFQFHIIGNRAVFLDYSRTWLESSFILERAAIAKDLDLKTVAIDVGRDLIKWENEPFEPLQLGVLAKKLDFEMERFEAFTKKGLARTWAFSIAAILLLSLFLLFCLIQQKDTLMMGQGLPALLSCLAFFGATGFCIANLSDSASRWKTTGLVALLAGTIEFVQVWTGWGNGAFVLDIATAAIFGGLGATVAKVFFQR